MIKHNQAEDVLRLANTYNRNLIETSLDPLVTIGPDGKIMDVNNATERATGYSRQELIGTDFSGYFTEPEKTRSGYRQVFKEGSVHDYPLEIRHRDGHIIPVLYNASVYYDETGKVVGVFAAARDITELKQSQEKLTAKNRMLTSINKYTETIVFSPPEELFATIATMLKEISGAAEIFINVYDEEKAELVLRKSTLSEENNTWVKKKFGDKLVDVRTPVPQDKYDEIMNSSLGRVGSLHEATFGAIPKSVGLIIEKMLGAGWFVGLALKHNKRLVGTIMIAGKKGSPELEKEELLAYASVTASVLAQKHAEADLFESENRFRSTFEQAAVGITHIDITGHWLQVNKKFCDIVGYTREELLQLTFQDITYPEDLNTDLELKRKMLDGQLKTYTLEKRYIRKDGSLVWINLTMALARKPSGDPDYFISVIEDITNRKQAEKAIDELNKTLELRVKQRTAELETINTELEAFSYSVSHDLRAPLRIIDGFSQVLLENYHDKLDKQGKHYLQRIRSNTQRMGMLIDDLLKLSRITRSEMKYEMIDLSAMAHLIIAEFYKIEPVRQVEFVIMLDLKARGDKHLIQLLLENLLSNAWKFTSKHSQARIEFGSMQVKGKQTFFVRDDGAGFDMTYVDKLFTPFQRLHSDREFPGIGIGLATIRRIINRHSGRIWAEAEIEKGAIFYFTLGKIKN